MQDLFSNGPSRVVCISTVNCRTKRAIPPSDLQPRENRTEDARWPVKRRQCAKYFHVHVSFGCFMTNIHPKELLSLSLSVCLSVSFCLFLSLSVCLSVSPPLSVTDIESDLPACQLSVSYPVGYLGLCVVSLVIKIIRDIGRTRLTLLIVG